VQARHFKSIQFSSLAACGCDAVDLPQQSRRPVGEAAQDEQPLRNANGHYSQAAQTSFVSESDMSSSVTPISLLESLASLLESRNHKSSQIRMMCGRLIARQNALLTPHSDFGA